jgi:hypothetical protein
LDKAREQRFKSEGEGEERCRDGDIKEKVVAMIIARYGLCPITTLFSNSAGFGGLMGDSRSSVDPPLQLWWRR